MKKDEPETGPMSEPTPSPSSSQRDDNSSRRANKAPSAPARHSGDTVMRLPFLQTNGKEIYLYDSDVYGVVAVSTEKNGACLIARIRGGDDVWLRDNDRNRWLLKMASNIETAEHLARAGRPRM